MNSPDHPNLKKSLSREEISDLACLSISEGLGDLQDAFDRWWESAPEADRAFYREEVDAAAMLILSISGTAEAPPLDLSFLEEPPLPAGFSHLRRDEGEWRELPVKGARIKELGGHQEDGFVTLLLELDAGTKFPGHEHHGAEHVYLLDGDLMTDGRKLSPGDFLRACANTYHSGLSSEGGCHALIMTAQQNYPQRSIKAYDRIAKSARRVFRRLIKK